MRFTASSLAAVVLVVVQVFPANAQQSTTLPAGDRALVTAPEPLFTLGKAEGAESETFSGILAVGFDSDDHLYVLDTQNHRVVVFDRAGRFMRQFGRRGGGPGELQFPMGLAVTRSGFVIIADVGKQAYLRYRTNGTFESSFPFAAGQRVSPQLRIRPHPREGVIVARQQPPDIAAMEKSAAAGQRITLKPATHIQAEPLTAGTSSPVLFVQQPRAETQPIDVGVGEMSFPMALPVQVHFAPGLHWGVLADGGVAVANEASYTVRIISASGAVTRVLTRQIEPRRVTKADRDRVLDAQRNRLLPRSAQLPPELRAMTEKLLKQMEENAQFAEVHPVIRELGTDGSGRIWVARNTNDGKTQLIDIIAMDGRYIGTAGDLEMPIAFSESGRFAQLRIDDDGVETIAVCQMPREWR